MNSIVRIKHNNNIIINHRGDTAMNCPPDLTRVIAHNGYLPILYYNTFWLFSYYYNCVFAVPVHCGFLILLFFKNDVVKGSQSTYCLPYIESNNRELLNGVNANTAKGYRYNNSAIPRNSTGQLLSYCVIRTL